MLLPKPRGSFSTSLFTALRDLPEATVPAAAPDDLDDESIALWALHELSYRGFDDVDDDAERDPEVLGVRRELERRLERRLLERWPGRPEGSGALADRFFEYVAAHDGPSLARHVQRHADRAQVLDLLRWRSVYHLKEADPTTCPRPRSRPPRRTTSTTRASPSGRCTSSPTAGSTTSTTTPSATRRC